ncbi:hypothetical protein NM688_g2260 [Phlebia brevispora]|uniref:Uncharacterized protein n=1 Tax=Phlebia brevispora TaxID=194682 RepID=A0ACC1T968_9APHY|nr:hypothetical protein NM688_g2260 [Phlebia brevispora]
MPNPRTQLDDDAIAQYNRVAYEQRLKRYDDDKQNGSIAAALGPPEFTSTVIQVPQVEYTMSQWNFEPGTIEPITFHTTGGHKGIRAADAVKGDVADLIDADEQLERLSDTSAKTTYRLQVENYLPDSKATQSRRATTEGGCVTRRIVANHVAKFIQDSIKRDGGYWEVAGFGRVVFHDLWLMELRRAQRPRRYRRVAPLVAPYNWTLITITSTTTNFSPPALGSAYARRPYCASVPFRLEPEKAVRRHLSLVYPSLTLTYRFLLFVMSHTDDIQFCDLIPAESTNPAAYEAREAFEALPYCLLNPIGSAYKLVRSSMPDEKGALRWTRVPAPAAPLSGIMSTNRKGPAAGSDIPEDVFDGIVDCFNCCLCGAGHDFCIRLPNHRCQCAAESVCSRQEMKQIALVCRRWAQRTRPKLFRKINLHRRKGGNMLISLVKQPAARISSYVQIIEGNLDGREQLCEPWIHHIGLLLLPNLPSLQHDAVRLALTIEGPVSARVMPSSIHPGPKCHPSFSSGICKLKLTDVHFKTFEHLVRLLREMPSLQKVECEQVTWDMQSVKPRPTLLCTSFMARDRAAGQVLFSTTNCTDDAAAAWLGIILGQTRRDVLQSVDAASLCTIASAWKGCDYESWRLPDSIFITCSRDISMTAYLTSTTGFGTGGPRRLVRTIILHLDSDASSQLLGSNIDWPKIDKCLLSFPVLEEILVCCSRRSFDQFKTDTLTKMPFLIRSRKLKIRVTNAARLRCAQKQRKSTLTQLPQLLYTSPACSSEPETIEPITFYVDGQKGIKVADALEGNFVRLAQPNKEFTQLINPQKRTYRLSVISCPSFSKVLSTCRVNNDPVTRRDVAVDVAVAVQECMQRDGGSWKLADTGPVELHDLWLMELRCVSEGSWQPVLALYREIAT